MKYVRIFVILVALGLALVPFPALATDAPTSRSVISSFVVRNAVEPGDMAIAFHYNIAYSDYPTELASETFMFRLYTSDLSEVLATSVPYSYSFNNGYGQGISGFYFSADDAPTWGEAYKINIAASPIYFDPVPAAYYSSLSNYSIETDQDASQDAMRDYILDVCHLLQAFDADLVLTGNTDYGEMLSAFGESYLRGAIPGISSIAPGLFMVQTYSISLETPTYNMSLEQTYKARLEDSDIMIGADRIGEYLFGVTGQTVMAFVAILACIALLLFLLSKGWGMEPGYIGSSIILTAAALLLGDAIFYIRIIMALLAGVFIMFLILGRRS